MRAVARSSELSGAAQRRAVAAQPSAVRISARRPSVRSLAGREAGRSLAERRVAETAHLEAAGGLVAASALRSGALDLNI